MNAEQMQQLAARLRDLRERFIFQGGSKFAVEMADLLDSMAQRPTLISEHVRDIERAIHAAEHPIGMSVHDGMAKIHSSLLRRLLAIAEAHGISSEK